MHARWSARKWVAARHVAVRSTRSASVGVAGKDPAFHRPLESAEGLAKIGVVALCTLAKPRFSPAAERTEGLDFAKIAAGNFRQMENGGSSSGRTTDSDSVYLGSNPSPPA